MSSVTPFSLTVQYADPSLKTLLTRSRLRRWVKASLLGPARITLRFVHLDEGRALNAAYRGQDHATNVLTFTYDHDERVVVADIVLCTEILQKEAKVHKKSLEQHAAHLVVHGVLHAQGYDHEEATQAADMEALETHILNRLGWDDPYA